MHSSAHSGPRSTAPNGCCRRLVPTALALTLGLIAPAFAEQELRPPRASATWLVGESSERRPDVALAPTVNHAPVELDALANPIVFDRKSLLAQASDAPARPNAGLGLKPTDPPAAWGTNKSYLIPAVEIIVFDTLLNLFDRLYFGGDDFDVTFSSIKRNIERGFATDSDSFTVNQLGHPYQGSMYHGFARASGLNFWEGFLYAFAGSAFWEIAGETTRPSTNDQIHTPIGGSLLGEALFRMANLWLEQGPKSRFWREVGAAVISPPVGVNRLAFDNRFKGVYPSNNPEYYARLAVGVSEATQNQPGTSNKVQRTEGILDFALDYGLPGRPGYTYRRPFDYFTFQATASTGIGFESVMTRGLLFGTDYGRGPSTYRGIWGLYGSYDYVAPQIFRLASSSLSIGTTLEWRPSRALAIQGSLLGGVGYATVSTINDVANERSNTYGVAPQAALALRFIFPERVAIDLSAREFYVSSVSGGGGHDNVLRADATLTWRIHGRHAVAVKYQYSRRDAEFPTLGDRTQSRGTVGIFYTWLGRDRFGTGDWK
jgi:hypothetical protein